MQTIRTQKHLKWFGMAPLFDPEEGQTIVKPPDSGTGWWAGAPNVIYDDESARFLISYRIRKPFELGRGVTTCIIETKDGTQTNTIWEGTKEELDSPSLERGNICKNMDGTFTLYLSYVDPKDLRWRIDYVRAKKPEEFNLSKRSKLMTAGDVSVEGVKDPYVILVGGIYYMYISYSPTPPQIDDDVKEQMHATADIFNTGITKSHTGLAISTDGVQFQWLGDVLSPKDGWDAYAARIGCMVHTPPGFTAFYDGSASVKENYEEKTGIAYTFDLKQFIKVSVDKPVLVSPHASGSLRYIDAVELNGHLYYFYEYARADGSHELRMNCVEL